MHVPRTLPSQWGAPVVFRGDRDKQGLRFSFGRPEKLINFA
jgi:hypothetical protein